ncbi:hypothetical protein ONS95_002917 [Cadophora gregata]|uniref:uncharacterized protein n=1 Tax=Cadophora gregata TaxID=51156 RepID=UPI0026DBA1C8|nr:uncharacterized protein ONS95_002917 [Cadophora gregata]KAK0108096.1 hypothetical protein ONS95_002917 [Cadophora gregata]KAK0109315.1 hypothetical protein ONS96_003134 [Cadophora gregata f. sp. sojae]
MPASFEEILSSRIFKFTVGQKVDGVATTFSVHEEAMAALSQPLHTLMRSGLSESEAGNATWEDISKDTFVRFAQFAYTGDYSVPFLVTPSPAPAPEPDLPVDAVHEREDFRVEELASSNEFATMDDPDWGGFPFKKSVGKKSKKQLIREMKGLALSAPTPPRNESRGEYEPSSTFEPWMDYSVLFICHASLWTLGNYRHVASLKTLALYKLHKTLCAFQLNSDNVGAVVNLVRCAYLEEGAGLRESISGLRKLVCQYLGMNKTLLCEDDGFMDLLAEGGQFVKDFFKYSAT